MIKKGFIPKFQESRKDGEKETMQKETKVVEVKEEL